MDLDHDPVHSPSHYTKGGMECFDALEACLSREQFLGFCRANAIKYLWRAGSKGPLVEDLEKAIVYVTKEITTRAKHEANPGPSDEKNPDIVVTPCVGSPNDEAQDSPQPPPAGGASGVRIGGVILNTQQVSPFADVAVSIADHNARQEAQRTLS